jgi:hypothetical protein
MGRENKTSSSLTLFRTNILFGFMFSLFTTLLLHYVWLLFTHIGWQIVFSDDDDDDDDTEALMAELERIKKERAEEKLRKVFLSLHMCNKF